MPQSRRRAFTRQQMKERWDTYNGKTNASYEFIDALTKNCNKQKLPWNNYSQ